LQMYNGANHFAYGAHGRWEIIAAQTVTEESDGTFTLQDLMRGRFGTECYMATHGVTDQIALLDNSRIRFVGMDVSNINISRLWRAVTRGAPLDSATDYPLVYSGVNLTPLSPCYANGYRNGASLDWYLTATRRTRLLVEPFSGLSAPIGESSEAYSLEIWNSSFTTLKRTISGLTSLAATYTQAQQVADFGSIQSTMYVRWRQISSVIGNGFPLQATISRVIDLDSRVLGLHFDGSDGSTAFVETTGKTATVYGGAQISTANYAPLTGNSSSGLFNGTNAYLSFPDSEDWNLGTGDFTIRFWVRPTGTSTGQDIVAQRKNSDNNNFFLIRRQSDEKIRVYAKGGGTVITDVASTGTLTASAQNYVEIVRTSGSVKISIGGTFGQTVTTDSSGAWPNVAQVLYVGVGDDTLTAGNFFAGNIDDLDILKGVAAHTTNFTPPTTPFA